MYGCLERGHTYRGLCNEDTYPLGKNVKWLRLPWRRPTITLIIIPSSHVIISQEAWSLLTLSAAFKFFSPQDLSLGVCCGLAGYNIVFNRMASNPFADSPSFLSLVSALWVSHQGQICPEYLLFFFFLVGLFVFLIYRKGKKFERRKYHLGKNLLHDHLLLLSYLLWGHNLWAQVC